MSGAIDADRSQPMSADDAWTAVATGVNYVSWLSKEFLYTGVSREDLIAEGRLGLFEAALRFDPSHGTQFLTYASFWARRRMQAYVQRHARVVRRPASRSAGPRDPEDVSLDEPIGSSKDLQWRDVLVDSHSPKVLDQLVGSEDAALITLATAELPPQWRKIIVRRYGLDGGPAMTLAAVGEALGLSRERVRQIEAKAMRSLRDRLEIAWSRRPAARRDAARSPLSAGDDHRRRQIPADVQGGSTHIEEAIDP